jgi:hypothetical protein
MEVLPTSTCCHVPRSTDAADVDAVLGGNARRVLRVAWQ